MRTFNVTTIISLIIISNLLLAQDFSGSYILQDYSPAVTLKLTLDDNGKVGGVITRRPKRIYGRFGGQVGLQLLHAGLQLGQFALFLVACHGTSSAAGFD